MLRQNPFYFALTRKYVALFGTLFNEIQVPRYDTDETTLRELLRVPILYGAKEKTLARLKGDPNADRPAKVTLPRLSFTHGSMQYDGSRKNNQIQKIVFPTEGANGTYTSVFCPAPYNVPFTLSLWTEFVSDGDKVIEQIIPFFVPDLTVSAELIPGVELNIPVTLNSVRSSDQYAGPFTEERVLTWDLDFTLKGWYFGPEHEAPLIKFANVSFYDATRFDDIRDAVGNTHAIDRVTVQPGLTANGEPTTNAAASIPYNEIVATDDFGYIVNISGILEP